MAFPDISPHVLLPIRNHLVSPGPPPLSLVLYLVKVNVWKRRFSEAGPQVTHGDPFIKGHKEGLPTPCPNKCIV